MPELPTCRPRISSAGSGWASWGSASVAASLGCWRFAIRWLRQLPFYGSAPPLDEIPNMSIPVLGIYAGEGQRIGAGVPGLEAALKVNNKTYRFQTFAGANHAFFNDTGRRYHPEAAGGAWRETLAWFETHLMS